MARAGRGWGGSSTPPPPPPSRGGFGSSRGRVPRLWEVFDRDAPSQPAQGRRIGLDLGDRLVPVAGSSVDGDPRSARSWNTQAARRVRHDPAPLERRPNLGAEGARVEPI